MSRKGLLTFALSLTVSAIAIAVAPGTVANAQSLTQVTNTQKITYSYGALNQATKDALTSMFDAEFYASENPQVVEAVGNSPAALLQHWLENGIWEGRPGNAKFDPSAYASANQDLKVAFGDNIVQYYIFYLDNKDDPARQITTVEQCITNGITVTSVIDTDIVITPQVYWTAKYLGTNDIRRISYHISQAEAVVEATGEEAVVKLDGEVTLKLKKNDAGYFEIYLNDSKTSYGAYLTYTNGYSYPDKNAVWELVAGEDVKGDGSIIVADGRIMVESSSPGNKVHPHFNGKTNDVKVTTENSDDQTTSYDPNNREVCVWNQDPKGTDVTEYTVDVSFNAETNPAGEITSINIDMETTSDTIAQPIKDDIEIDVTEVKTTSNNEQDD